MPPSLRARGSRGSSRPYRRSPTTNPVQTTQPLAALEQPVSPSPATTPDTSDGTPTTPPDRPGLPTYAEYKRIETGYLRSLSPRKRDKALITQAMFDKIWDVLHQPDACTIETPQFRFWVRKMFRLSRPVWASENGGDGGKRAGRVVWTCGAGEGERGEQPVGDTTDDSDSDAEAEAEAQDLALERAMGIGSGGPYLVSAVVLHENRPVAIMEQLYELFCYCHVRAGHGGRDKTCTVIRQHYSWVPKELTAQFVKACPTCAIKRSGIGIGIPGMVGVGTVRSNVGARARVGTEAVVQRRTGRREKKTLEEVAPRPSLEFVWPTTSGPLDPTNPEPFAVRERKRERQQAWFGVREDVKLQSSPTVSPTSSLLTAASPYDQPAGYPPQLSRTPTRTGLPPALSNESLGENIHLHLHLGLSPTARAMGDAGDPERRLPPIMQPLRLLGPCVPGRPSDSGSPSSGSSSSATSSSWTNDSPSAHAHALPIDPVLLSFDYPRLVHDLDTFEDVKFSWRGAEEMSLSAFVDPAGTPSPSEEKCHGLGLRQGQPEVARVPAGDGRGQGASKGHERRRRTVQKDVYKRDAAAVAGSAVVLVLIVVDPLVSLR